MNQEIITLSFLSICIVLFMTRQLAQLRQLKTAQIFIITDAVALAFFVVIEWMLLLFNLELARFESSLKALVAMMFALYLAMVSLIIIQDNSTKKIRTLWRIPILGLLAGTYFEMKYITYIAMGNLLLLLILPLRQKLKFRYLLVKIWPLALCLPGLYYVSVENITYVNIFLMFCVVGSNELIKILNANGILRAAGKVQ